MCQTRFAEREGFSQNDLNILPHHFVFTFTFCSTNKQTFSPLTPGRKAFIPCGDSVRQDSESAIVLIHTFEKLTCIATYVPD